jgi:hypothetical protein
MGGGRTSWRQLSGVVSFECFYSLSLHARERVSKVISKYYSFFDVSIVPRCFLFVPFTIVRIVRVFLIFFEG